MDFVLILFIATAFVAVAGLVFVTGDYVGSRMEVQRRLPSSASVADSRSPTQQSGVGAFVAQRFTEERFGVDINLKQKLRRELVRAGFFSPYAVRYYVFARFAAW